MTIDFSEFPPISKEDWLAQVTKDLKGKPLESFYWQPAVGLVVSPFVHAGDFTQPAVPLEYTPNAWQICEDVDAGEPIAANLLALKALEFGTEGLCFQLPEAADPTLLRQVLQRVYLDFVGLHFAGPAVERNPSVVLAGLQQLAAEQGLASAQLHGSLAYDPVTSAPFVDWRYLVDLLLFARTSFPGFRLLAVSAPETSTDVVEELAQLLRQGQFYLQKLTQRGVSATEIAAVLHFQITIGKSYFLEIAKIRAFKILWLNVLRVWEAPLEYPPLSARFSSAAYTDDLYSNMVRATTMAMSAVLGGVDRLTVLPYAAGREAQVTYPPEFGRRIARNVQHLLKMESGFDQVADPAAGSYFVEKLTDQLAQWAWAKFIQPA